MKKRWEIAFVSVLCGLLILAVSAAPLRQAQDKQHSNQQQPGQRGWFDEGLGRWLGLTPEQQSQLDALRKAHEDQHLSSGAEMRKLRDELRALGEDTKSDPGKADGLIDRLSKLVADRMKSGFRFHQDLEKILTPEQREKMARFRSRFAARDEHRGFDGMFPSFRGGFGHRGFLRPCQERGWGGFLGGFAHRGFFGPSGWRLERVRHFRRDFPRI